MNPDCFRWLLIVDINVASGPLTFRETHEGDWDSANERLEALTSELLDRHPGSTFCERHRGSLVEARS